MMQEYQPFPLKGLPPYIFAHRGISGKAPENTLASFALALETQGIAGVELDVRLSRDEEVIVLHDPKLERTTTGNGLARKYTLEEIKKYDAGSWFHSNFSRERVPALREVFQLFGGRRWVNIEIKSEYLRREPPGLLERRVIDTVKECGYSDWVLYSSFDHRLLERLKTIEPSAKTGVLYNVYRSFYRLPSTLAASSESEVFVCARHELRRRMLDDAHDHHIAVYAYTLNSARAAERTMEMGVDGILSDNADEIVALIQR